MTNPLLNDLTPILTRELQAAWHQEARLLFGKGVLKPPVIVVDENVQWGTWMPKSRTIRLSRGLIMTHTWGVVLEVLKHEMAHQYVSEVLKIDGDETSHGPAFREVCARYGIDGTAAGMPDDSRTTTVDHVTDRIKKLLRLAESGNENEAKAAAEAARRLMLKHNIEQVEKNEARGYTIKHVGGWVGKRSGYLRKIVAMLTDSFFVEAIWIYSYSVSKLKWGMELEISGTPENVAVAAYVYDFVRQEIDRLWKASGLAGKFRQSFAAGVVQGLRDTLAKEKRVEQQRGIVWVGDPKLNEYFNARHPKVRHTRWAGPSLNEGYASGKEAGASIQIRRAMNESGVGPRLLTGLPALPDVPDRDVVHVFVVGWARVPVHLREPQGYPDGPERRALRSKPVVHVPGDDLGAVGEGDLPPVVELPAGDVGGLPDDADMGGEPLPGEGYVLRDQGPSDFDDARVHVESDAGEALVERGPKDARTFDPCGHDRCTLHL